MSTLLKDLYNDRFFNLLTPIAQKSIKGFDKTAFLKLVYNNDWPNKELKQRVRHLASCIHVFMPERFDKAAPQLLELTKNLQKKVGLTGGFEFMFLPDYVEAYGTHYYEHSMECIEQITPFISCEFAVRPFIINHTNQALKQLLAWTKHPNHHVRRLASEGCRPRLPWGAALAQFKKNPQPILPIIEALKADPSEYVRRSVANNLNDISKDHHELVLRLTNQWIGNSTETDALLKHACRNLLKAGNAEALKLFGIDSSNFNFSNFTLLTPALKLGEYVQFSFTVKNTKNLPQKMRLEYCLYFLRNNGAYHKKVFKISERTLAAYEEIQITKQQPIKEITTRKYYEGVQKLSVVVNGVEHEPTPFMLIY